MIVATAVSFGCDCIYSNDTDIEKFGRGFIDYRQIPPLDPIQLDIESLLDDIDLVE